MSQTKTCFVIQGFGEKQDYTSGRTFNLDASYEVIKEAVEAAGFRCVRADEIRHAGTIDVPMYQQILNADLVIADLSTYNVNAAYELGVRHALRPRTTIIVAESGFKYPFDFSHIAIRRYEHLGKDIGRMEAKRFQKELTESIVEITSNALEDSPVYTFLPGLAPPALPRAAAPAAGAAGGARAGFAPPIAGPAPARADAPSVKSILDDARGAMRADDFANARSILAGLHAINPKNEQVTQMLVLATYKSGQPTPHAALLAARDLLVSLHPRESHDTETLGLWGAVHKRLWDFTGDAGALDEAVGGYERGFQLKQDIYNGINLAFLLDVRARATGGAEGVADTVLARRTRQRVMEVARTELAKLPPLGATLSEAQAAEVSDLRFGNDRRYWILATLQEAAVGLGDLTSARGFAEQAAALHPAGWMLKSTADQIDKLRMLLAAPMDASGPNLTG
jgi:hypothetical protein